jgi:hypothetical protein
MPCSMRGARTRNWSGTAGSRGRTCAGAERSMSSWAGRDGPPSGTGANSANAGK